MKKFLKYILSVVLSLTGLAHAYAEPLEFQVGVLKYQELQDRPGCVCASLGRLNSDIPSLVIPGSVDFNGVSYNVVGISNSGFSFGVGSVDYLIRELIISEGIEYIGNKAFEYSTTCIGLKKLVLPSTLKKIGYNAFARLGVKEIIIPDSVEEIGGGAFFGSKALKRLTLGKGLTHIPTILGYWFETPTYGQHFDGVEDLYLTLSTPPSVTNDKVVNEPSEAEQISLYLKFPKDYEQCTLHVPAGSLEAYRNHPAWGKFKQIVDDAESGIEDAVADSPCAIKVEGGRIVAEGHVEVYDLGGRKVVEGMAENLPELPAGFYIVRTPEATAKVVL